MWNKPRCLIAAASKFHGIVRVDVHDLGSCPDEVLEGREGIVSALARNRVDPLPIGIPVMDNDSIFVTE